MLQRFISVPLYRHFSNERLSPEVFLSDSRLGLNERVVHHSFEF